MLNIEDSLEPGEFEPTVYAVNSPADNAEIQQKIGHHFPKHSRCHRLALMSFIDREHASHMFE